MRKIYLLLCGLLLVGCSIKDVEKEFQNYRLETQNSFAKEDRSDKRVLLVQKVEGDTIAMSKTIFYEEDGALKPFKYSRWSEIPSIRLQQQIVESFERQGLFFATVPSLSLANSDLVLESDLSNFEQVLEEGKSFVHVKMRFRLIQRGSTQVLGSTILEVKEDVKGVDTHSVIEAFNKASSKLITDLSSWIKSVR